MSDIYLTKVERKTIFTQGLIYVLFTFVISDLTVTGPHVFSIIPWLFFLGILGVNKFYHPIMTVCLSCVTTFIASLFKYDGLNIQVLTSVLVALSMTTAGLIVGLCIKDFVLEHRLVKQLSVNKKITNIVVCILLTIASVLVYSARYGNVIGYIKSRIKLDNYIKVECEIKEYEIENQQFMPGSFADYVYVINVDNNKLNLSVKDDVQILNFQEIKEKLETTLNDEFNNIDSSVLNVKLSYEFSEVNAKPVGIIATVNIKNVDVNNKDALNKIVIELKNVIQYRDNRENNVIKIILSINSSVQVINEKDFHKISEEYIVNSVNIETLDMY